MTTALSNISSRVTHRIWPGNQRYTRPGTPGRPAGKREARPAQKRMGGPAYFLSGRFNSLRGRRLPGWHVMNQTRRSHKHAWIAGIVILITAISSLAAVHHVSPNEQDGIYFHTLPPGARLPSGVECARQVRASPSPESRSMNTLSNRAIGYHVKPSFFPPGDSWQVAKLAPQISGDFTGTTQQVLQWAACKWGIDQKVVFAQAAVESWWEQDELGDWTANAQLCPPDHRIGADGKPGKCPQSYGILQNRYSLEKSAWPGIGVSTAMNADAAYAIWRSCYDGYEVAG